MVPCWSRVVQHRQRERRITAGLCVVVYDCVLYTEYIYMPLHTREPG